MPRKGENIVKRKDGRWEARVMYSKDVNGKAKYRYLYGKTYAEARAKKEYALSQIISCQPQVPKNSLTLNQLIDQFMVHKSARVKESTLTHYKDLVKRYISTPLGNLKLLQISKELIDEYIVNLLDSGKVDGCGLSEKTVHDILSLLKSIFRYAVSLNYMPADILNITMPRMNVKETTILTPAEQQILEQYAIKSGNRYYFGFYLCLYSGLRIGEICALKWADIDFKQSTISVRRTIQRISTDGGKKTKIIITEPKTRTSIRTIPIPSFLLEMLKERRKSVPNRECYVLTGTEKYIEPSNYYMRYQRCLKRLHLPSYSFHTLRHTFATRCIEKGFDPKSLSEILGHSDVKITLNRYVHPSMELKRYHMERLAPSESA